MRLKLRKSIVGSILLYLSAASIAMADYPERSVNLILPFPPGGGMDAAMRTFAKAFQDITGQVMTVENKPGAQALVALSYLAGKKPDGYNVGIVGASQLTAYWMADGKVPVTPLEDIDYLVGTHDSVFALLVPAESPFNSVEDIVNFSQQNPDRVLTIGTVGQGSPHYKLALALTQKTGINADYVPFKGEVDSNNAAIGGHIDLSVSTGSFVPLVEGQRLKVIALATPERLDEFPDWKTFHEQGYDIVTSNQVGLGAPKGVPAETIDRFEEITQKVLEHPEFVATMQRMYQPIRFMDHDSFQAMANKQNDEQREFVKSQGLSSQ